MTNFQKVKTFMQTFGQEVKSKPSFSSEKINDLRYKMWSDKSILKLPLRISFLIISSLLAIFRVIFEIQMSTNQYHLKYLLDFF